MIINDDKELFVKNLKNIPDAHPLIDKCIECGFREVICPSRELTLTSATDRGLPEADRNGGCEETQTMG